MRGSTQGSYHIKWQIKSGTFEYEYWILNVMLFCWFLVFLGVIRWYILPTILIPFQGFWVRGLWYKVGSTKQFHSHQCHASVLNIEPWAFRRVSWLIWHSSLLYPWEKFRKQSAKKYNIVSKGNNLWDLTSERIILRTDMIWIFDILGTK